MRAEPAGQGLAVELSAGSEAAHVGGGFEREGEGEAVGRGVQGPEHEGEGGDGVPGRVRVGEAADDGVVHEGVGVGDAAEEEAGVVEAAGEVDGAVEEQFSGDEWVCFEAGFGGSGLELVEGFQGSAVVQE
ncbi:proline-tRNA ligase [Striga asiatica]|uniref:Proline-tRNA ligase n=1 Tax=Striga asiatica TaxID=4170 RepID=A0A5A7R755_STRAF|nr:proline-tRNA ligase [Striga asiatica]